MEVHFAPTGGNKGGCTDSIVNEINGAKKSIHVQAYILNSQPIIEALRQAQAKGAKVEIIHDYNSLTNNLINSKLPFKLDRAHQNAHDKVIIIDNNTVITGSFNFTQSAENQNSENLLIIRDRGIVKQYIKHWEEHAKHSSPLN
jgi:phosphatidylserine/phosphatidylglycerophosphate/cardiolipin synthase-like enzyme